MKRMAALLTACVMISAMVEMAWGQTTVSWNFGTSSGTASPSSGTPVEHLTISDISIGNTYGSVIMLSTSSASTGYTGASGQYNAGNAARTGALNTGNDGSAYFEFTLTPETGYTVTLSSISFGTRSTSTGPQAYTLRYSTDSYTSDLATGTISNNSTWYLKSNTGLSIVSTSGTALTFRIYGYNGTGNPSSGTINWRIDDLSIDVTVNSASSPSIAVVPSSLSGFTYIEGSGPSTSQSYNLSGSNLTPASGNLTVTGSTNYEVSTDNSTFSSSVNVGYTGGALSETPIYVRLKAGLSAGSYNGETIANSGGGATTQNVTCNGTVTTPAYYFRSKTSGNWGDASTWEKSPDLSTWSDASVAPSSTDYTIEIQNGHTVTIAASVTADQITVASGGQLTIASGQTLTVANGDGTDLTINGTVLNSGTLSINSGSTWAVNAGGTFIYNTTTGISTPLNSATLDAASNFIYRGSSSLTPAPSVSGRTYGNLTFESTSGTYSPSISGSYACTVNGNLTIGENVALSSTMTANLVIKGNFINNGTFTTTSQTVVFQGTSAQSISGSSTTTFYGLTLDNSNGLNLNASAIVSGALTLTSGTLTVGANTLTLAGSSPTRTSGQIDASNASATLAFTNTNPITLPSSLFTGYIKNLTLNGAGGVTLETDLNITGTLTLTSGNITTGGKLVTLGMNTSSIGTLSRTSGTIIGNFRRWFATGTNTNFLFPVGTATNYRPVIISTAGVTTGGLIMITHTDGSGGADLSSPLDDGGYAINRRSNMYWTLTGYFISGGIYDLSVDANGQSGISDATKVRLINSTDGSNFSLVGTHSAGSGTVFNRTGIDIGNFGRFYLGSNVSDNSLPVTLTSFTAQPSGSGVVLNWTTESEFENQGFNIYRKLLGGEYSLLASFVSEPALRGAGSSSEAHSYSYTDRSVQSGLTYTYLLSDVSYAGVEKKHTEKAVTVALPAGINQVAGKYRLDNIYPNPFNPSFTLPLTLGETQPVEIAVYDGRGAMVRTLQRETLSAGSYQLHYTLNDLGSGVYFLNIKVGGNTEIRKIVLMK